MGSVVSDGTKKFALSRSKSSRSVDRVGETNVNDLPGAVLTSIFGLLFDPRTRNSMSLVCKDWYYLERQTRSTLTLRGNLCDPELLPVSFKNVTNLDLSFCSPWGYSIFQSTARGEDVGRLLQEAFPNVKDLAIYVRDAVDIHMVVWLWPELESLRLVRWHQRAMELGSALAMESEVEPLLKCQKLRKLDLSAFYCWTEDILPVLKSGTATAANLLSLNLLKISPEGFKTQEITAITSACSNLEELYLLCEFDPRFLDSVGDSALESIASNCPRLRVLHLVDNNEWGARSSDLHDRTAMENANVTRQGLESMFRRLPYLQTLSLLLSQNVWASGQALEALFTNCKKLSSLHLSHFHGVCVGLDDGLAMGTNLQELCIKDCVDLSDGSLASIARGCRKLKRLSLQGCREITEQGVSDCVRALCGTLVDVEIICCKLLPAVQTLRALEPIRNSIQRLHVDCVWNDEVVSEQAASIAAYSLKNARNGQEGCPISNKAGRAVSVWDCDRNRSTRESLHFAASGGSVDGTRAWASETRRADELYGREDGAWLSASGWNSDGCLLFGNNGDPRGSSGRAEASINSSSDHVGSRYPDESILNVEGSSSSGAVSFTVEEAPDERCWRSLHTLSLWIGVSLLISHLPSMGLGRCPVLKEVSLKVEGDCKALKRPAVREWGLATLSRYRNVDKLNMDLGDVVSFSLSAPEGTVDLSIWERHFLSGIDQLQLRELDYRPPCDKDLNHRGLSLPAVGHLSQCLHIRKLIVHGSVHEHFLSMLQNKRLRDFQLRWDFYPAPEYETSTEVRVEACKRFEAALAERGFPD